MGSRCYDCGEKVGRCYEHAGNCPSTCSFGTHPCPGDWEGNYSTGGDLITEVEFVKVPNDEASEW